MSVLEKVKRFALDWPPGKLFYTKQLLHLGTRRQVDQALHRLVKRGFLTRAARGVFHLKTEAPSPTAFEIASVKAEAFGKKIATGGKNSLAELEEEGHQALVFASDGRSSSFASIHGRIYLKGTTMNRVHAGNTHAGMLIRVLAFIGQSNANTNKIRCLTNSFTVADVAELYSKMPRYMTTWMHNQLLAICLVGKDLNEAA